MTKETKEKIRLALTGKPKSEQHRANLRGKVISERHREILRRCHIGHNNPQWCGDNASLNSIHRFVKRRNPPPDQCQSCSMVTADLDLACITGIYDRDFKNYRYLCPPCHVKLDKTKDMSDRRCCYCGSDKTRIRKTDGRQDWYGNERGWWCNGCYQHLLDVYNWLEFKL